MDLHSLIRTRREPSARRPLRVLFATSEIAPFSKTGGLADVSAALPQALARLGHEVSVLTPLYGHLDAERMRLARRMRPLEVRVGARGKKIEAAIYEAQVESARLFFVDAAEYFDREGIYVDEKGEGYEDNPARFAFFSRAIVDFALAAAAPFDIIHLNDWHTSLAPVYARHYHDDEFARTAFVLTIHNLAYQGAFDDEAFKATGLPKTRYYSKPGEVRGAGGEGVNFLRAGIVRADAVTTVSPTYAREIQEEGRGFGLEGALGARGDSISGILNGADYRIWSPERDRHIAVRYDADSLNHKRRNKADLQHAFGLPVRPTLPLMGFVGRLAEQKGLDILVPALREMLAGFQTEREGFQIALLGEGEAQYADALGELARDFPRRVAFHEGYDEAMAHRIQAGADIFLVPSRFEPCGLTQIYAMRYGTLPLVHRTGGLADTVTDAEREGGTGFVFDAYEPGALAETIARATEAYRHYRRWRPLMIRAMEQDFSWQTAAEGYTEIYRDAQGALGVDDEKTRASG